MTKTQEKVRGGDVMTRLTLAAILAPIAFAASQFNLALYDSARTVERVTS